MATFDVFLDPLTGDLPAVSRFVTGPELTVQRARVRLGTFFGEWILNRFVGIDYPGIRQQKPPDLPAFIAIVTAELAGTPGVIRVDSIDAVFDPVTRTITTAGRATIEGNEPVDELAAAFSIAVGGNTTPAVITFYLVGPIAPL